MNFLHSNYIKAGKILDDDMLYTLSLFALEPVRWINRYEWRNVSEFERCALGTFWKSIGDAMEISYDALPSSKTGFRDGLHWFEEIEAWSVAYEAKAMVPHKDNYMTANATIEILLWEVPSFLKPLGRKSVYLLMEDRLRAAMMYVTHRPPNSFLTIFITKNGVSAGTTTQAGFTISSSPVSSKLGGSSSVIFRSRVLFTFA